MATKKESKKQQSTKKVPEDTQTPQPENNRDTKNESQEPPERNAKGQFVKGRKKTGGRQLGTPNKYSNVRDRLKEQIEPFLDCLGEMIMRAERQDGAAAALTAIEKFMPYFTPKYSAVSIGADQDRPLSEEEALMEMDAKYKKKELEINIKSLTIVNNDNLPDDFDPDNDPDLSFKADAE